MEICRITASTNGTPKNTIHGTNVRVSISVRKYKGKGDSGSAKRYRNKVIDG